MGVNKLLKAGIEKEQAQLKDVAAKKEEKKTSEKAEVTVQKKEPPKKESIVVKEVKPEKNKGGRPTNKEKGLKSRKQYTLTLKEDDYSTFLEAARDNDLSFAKFMEKAAFEYIENHRTVE
ncbi:hypothetical protein [Butyrivibrio sp. AE3004]|uniref:hypothetical protein n=1 Tax=Butyrivibrio sp. AE3004 TaxID=1506994 RepID=UPI000494CD7E|nr:hypothetical protein [Butyrivibrio sp. AE3004]